jgi:hypothetical protein
MQLLLLAGVLLGQFAQAFGRASARQLGECGGKLLADLGHGVQHGVGQVTQDVTLGVAELMGNWAKNSGNRRRIAGSAIRGDGAHLQAARRQGGAKALKESQRIGLGRFVVKHLVG